MKIKPNDSLLFFSENMQFKITFEVALHTSKFHSVCDWQKIETEFLFFTQISDYFAWFKVFSIFLVTCDLDT